MTHPNSTANQWSAAAAAAAAAAARLARRTRIRFGETPHKPADIAEWNLGSSFTEPVFCFWVKEFKVGTLLFRVCVSVSLLPQPPPPPPLVGPPNSHVATPPTTCCCRCLCPYPTPPFALPPARRVPLHPFKRPSTQRSNARGPNSPSRFSSRRRSD